MLKKFKTCLFCGSFHLKKSSFCSPCYHELVSRIYAPRVLIVNGLLIRPLFLWNESNDKWVRHLIYSLKRGGVQSEQNMLAILFLSTLGSCEMADFFCAPGNKGDHAHEWAAGITNKIGRPFLSPFKRKGVRQKEKTRKERLSKSVYLSEGVVPTRESNKAIFLDDVVATGSTAGQCLELLGGYVKKEAWCIAYKARCGGIGPLL